MFMLPWRHSGGRWHWLADKGGISKLEPQISDESQIAAGQSFQQLHDVGMVTTAGIIDRFEATLIGLGRIGCPR